MSSTITPRARPSAWTVDTIQDTAAFVSLAPEWKELLHDSSADGLFLTWQWTFCWWKHLAGPGRLNVLALRRDGQLCALAPLLLQPPSIVRVPPGRALQFLGSGVAGSDYLDLIVRSGCEQEAVPILAQRLQQASHGLSLMRMRPDGPARMLIERLRGAEWRVWEGPAEACPFACVRGSSFEQYLASLGSEHRYAFRRKLARLERDRAPSFELARTDEERREALAILFALHARRWGTRGEPGAFATPELRAFHDHLSRLAMGAGWLRLWVLRLAGQPVAALYAFVRRRTFYFYQAGFDPAFARDSVGMVLLGVAIREAMREGIDEVDLLHGTERYKAHWAGATRELSRFELHAPGPRGFVEHEATALLRRARRLTRTALELGERLSARNHVASS